MKKEGEITINIEKFVSFHKARISLLEEFLQKKINGRLIFQISFLGFESLARVLYQEDKDSRSRFAKLLSIKNRGIEEKEAKKLYDYWRNSLVHNGFIKSPWTTLEGWNQDDISFLSFPEGLKSSVEFPPGSILGLYNDLIDYFDEFFKKQNITTVELRF
jgi:hypothetical protein